MSGKRLVRRPETIELSRRVREIFARRFTDMCRADNINREGLAAAFDISVGRYHSMQTSQIFPDEATLVLIANYFNVSFDYLYGNVSWKNNEEWFRDLMDRGERKRLQVAGSRLEVGEGKKPEKLREVRDEILEEVQDRMSDLSVMIGSVKSVCDGKREGAER